MAQLHCAMQPQAISQQWQGLKMPLQSAQVGPGRRHPLCSPLSRRTPSQPHSIRRRATAHAQAIPAVVEAADTAVSVEVEQGPSNSRRLYAGIDIAAPWTAVWSALTNYDGLDTFIPGLAQNECLSRHAAGCRLLQVGEQSLALGLKFRAKVVLDIKEHPEGVPRQLIDDEAVDLGCFPGPRSSSLRSIPHDISFSLHEGDFQAFRGIWRIQEHAVGANEEPSTRLSYALFVRPQKWMPIAMIQSRIEGEVANNLNAVKRYAQREAVPA